MSQASTQQHESAEAALDRDAAALHAAVADLVRVYQFRDRDRICCHDISVTQCYALETLVEHGPLRLNALADRLFLDKSTTSRVVGTLVRRGTSSRAPTRKTAGRSRCAQPEKGAACAAVSPVISLISRSSCSRTSIPTFGPAWFESCADWRRRRTRGFDQEPSPEKAWRAARPPATSVRSDVLAQLVVSSNQGEVRCLRARFRMRFERVRRDRTFRWQGRMLWSELVRMR